MQNENIRSCGICYEPFSATRLFTVGECNHSGICSICALRNRHLLNDYSCSFCKQDMEYVVCSSSSTTLFHHFERWGDDLGADFELDCKSRMFFPKQYYKDEVCPLKQHVCPESACKKVYRDSKSLKNHLAGEHGKVLCDLCAENKNFFPAEQLIYTQDEYSRHIKTGDCDGSKGHPSCRFCKKRFYDVDTLFQHLERNHFSCHICSQNIASISPNLTYFRDYSSLHTHFRKEHHICHEPECLESKFTVFSNQISLLLHHKQYHPCSQLSAHPTVSIDNSCKHRHSKDVHFKKKSLCSQYEGGCGGYVVDGEWEVKLEGAHFMPNSVEKAPSALLTVPSSTTMDFSEQEYPSISSTKDSPDIVDRLLGLNKRFRRSSHAIVSATECNAKVWTERSQPCTLRTVQTDFPLLSTTSKTMKPSIKNSAGEHKNNNTEKKYQQRKKTKNAYFDPSWGSALNGLSATSSKSSSKSGRNIGCDFKKISVYKPSAYKESNAV